MSDALLWNLDEAARQLGGVSSRTVRRLMDRGAIRTQKVGRRRLVVAASVREWLDAEMTAEHTDTHAGLGVQGGSACRRSVKTETKTVSTKGRTRRTGGRRTSTQAARELAEVLALPTGKKPKRS